MRPWPAAAISTASFEGDDERLNRVKRIFIKAERDHMLNPEQQDSMIKKWPPSEVLVIDTDHSPFFSAPEQLFSLIAKSLWYKYAESYSVGAYPTCNISYTQ